MLNKRHQELDKTNWDHVIVSVSGGKDSSVLMAWAVANFPKEKLVCVHAVIDIDWKETISVVREQAKFFDLPLIEVQAKHADGSDKGFLSVLSKKRVSRKTGEEKEAKFPDMCNRWCTSELKIAPIDKYVRTLKGNILVLIGERAEESVQRSELDPWRPDQKLSVNGRKVVKHSPILEMLETDVWSIIKSSGVPVHPVYSWGVSRASCAICIFSSDKEIAIAYEKAPEIVSRYINTELKIEHSFRYKPETKKRPALKVRIVDILMSEGFDMSAFLNPEGV